MTEWQSSTWGDLGKLHYGKALHGYRDAIGSVEVFGTNGPIGWTDEELFSPGIVVGRKGAYRGIHYARAPCWVIDTAFWLELLDPNVIHPRWAFWQLRTVDLDSIDSGSAIPSTSRDAFAQIPVRLPPLATQSAVASRLDVIDDLIENNRRRVDVLEEMARAIYREWFVHFRFPGHEDAAFVDSDLGLIPDRWQVTRLGSVAKAERLTVHPKEEPEILFDHYSIPAFDSGQLPTTEVGESIKSGKYALDEPAVMVSKLNPRIPRAWYVEPDRANPSVASTEFVILRPNGKHSLDWIYATVTSTGFADRMVQLSAGTSGSHQRLRPAEMLAIKILDPPIAVIDRVTDALRPSLSMARSLRSQSRGLAKIRDMLLPKLVTGQIDVSGLDLDALVEKSGV